LNLTREHKIILGYLNLSRWESLKSSKFWVIGINCLLKRAMLKTHMPYFFLPIIAFFIGMIAVQAGVSGAFLLLPVQISLLGITSPVASATNLAYNIIAIPVAVLRFKKEKRFILPLILAIIAGAGPGVLPPWGAGQ